MLNRFHEQILRKGLYMSNVLKFKSREFENSVLPNKLLSLEDIEEKYNIKYQTAYKYIVSEHKIPYYKLGRNIRIDERDIIYLFDYKGV